MTRRRIYDLPGHAHFITFSCNGRRKLLNQDRCKRIVIAHLEKIRSNLDCRCFGFVIMPEHVHALIWFQDEGMLSHFAQEWKRQSSIAITECFRRMSNPVLDYIKRQDGSHRVWQRKYYDFNVFTPGKAIEKLNYMHNNPVTRGLVKSPEDWPFGSARWYANRTPVGVKIAPLEI